MNIKQFFPSRWLSADDLGQRRVEVTISDCTVEQVRDFRTGETVNKLAVSFERATKKLLPNKTQAFAIADIAGSYDTEKWVGLKISLCVGMARNKKATIIVERAALQAEAAQLNGHGEEGAE